MMRRGSSPAAVGSAGGAEAAIAGAATGALTAAIKRHIEAEIEAPSLTAETLCKRFGVSRTQLYRLLEPDGGLYRYIRGSPPARPRVPPVDVARRRGDAPDRSCIRIVFQQRQHLHPRLPSPIRHHAWRGARVGDGARAKRRRPLRHDARFDPAAALRQLRGITDLNERASRRCRGEGFRITARCLSKIKSTVHAIILAIWDALHIARNDSPLRSP